MWLETDLDYLGADVLIKSDNCEHLKMFNETERLYFESVDFKPEGEELWNGLIL